MVKLALRRVGVRDTKQLPSHQAWARGALRPLGDNAPAIPPAHPGSAVFHAF
jgi:hypothetical protein